MIALIGVAVLAVAGVGIAVLSAVAGRSPDRAAVMVVLAAAAGGVGLLLVLTLGLLTLGLAGSEAAGEPGPTVAYDPVRTVAGLAGAGVLLLVAGWLKRTGDWDRPDD